MAKAHVLLEVFQLLRTDADRTVRWHLAAAVALVTTGGLLAALAPLALKGMVDAVAGAAGGEHPLLPQSALLLGAAYLVALAGGRALGELRPLLTGTAEQRLLARLTQRFFAHLLALPLQFHLGRRPGELVHGIHLATTGCQLLTAHLVNTFLPVLVEVAAVAAVLVHLNQPELVVTFAATALAYVIVFGLGSLKLAGRAHLVSGASLNVNAALTDTLLNCETVKCFVAEPASREKLASATDVLESRWRHLYHFRVRLGMAAAAIFTVSLAVSLSLAADAVAQGTLTIGGFVMASVYMLQIVRPLEMLGSAARDVSQALGFIRPLLGVLKEPTDAAAGVAAVRTDKVAARDGSAPNPTAKGAALACTKSPGVRFEMVCFGYDPQRPVLKSLDLDIAAGRSLAIVGASGSGKSSLVRLLLRLYEPQAGRIVLGRNPLYTLHPADVRALIGLVPQDTILFNDTLANNIGLGKRGAARIEIQTAARRAQLHDFITSLPMGYDTVVGERGLKLSGGERQRVAIARVLLKAPRIFVFDEATSMLDSQTEAAILRDLHTVSEGCTTITIAHRLSTVRNADEIAVLAHGEIKERGTHGALLSQAGIYAGLWNRQMHGAPM
jgi:ABC-type transport system involved in Fe-S cluster assembly fused permease/ATPase subunit